MTYCDHCERSPCECDLVVCNCSVCSRELLSRDMRYAVRLIAGRDDRGRPLVAGRVGDRPYCPVCLKGRRAGGEAGDGY
jgi:hypothetical protein